MLAETVRKVFFGKFIDDEANCRHSLADTRPSEKLHNLAVIFLLFSGRLSADKYGRPQAWVG